MKYYVFIAKDSDEFEQYSEKDFTTGIGHDVNYKLRLDTSYDSIVLVIDSIKEKDNIRDSFLNWISCDKISRQIIQTFREKSLIEFCAKIIGLLWKATGSDPRVHVSDDSHEHIQNDFYIFTHFGYINDNVLLEKEIKEKYEFKDKGGKSVAERFPNWKFYALSSQRCELFNVMAEKIIIPEGNALKILPQKFEKKHSRSSVVIDLLDRVSDCLSLTIIDKKKQLANNSDPVQKQAQEYLQKHIKDLAKELGEKKNELELFFKNCHANKDFQNDDISSVEDLCFHLFSWKKLNELSLDTLNHFCTILTQILTY